MTLFRIPEPDELVVGDESLLYGDEWTSFSYDDGNPITLQFRQNFSDVIWTEDGNKMTFNYTYNSDSQELVFTVDGKTEAFKIIKLTDHVMYLATYENGELVDGMEFRKL